MATEMSEPVAVNAADRHADIGPFVDRTVVAIGDEAALIAARPESEAVGPGAVFDGANDVDDFTRPRPIAIRIEPAALGDVAAQKTQPVGALRGRMAAAREQRQVRETAAAIESRAHADRVEIDEEQLESA